MPTALIVEDELPANKLLSRLVQLRGYQTESAFDGTQALHIVQNHIPDVVLLDLMLPDMDGYQVCQSLKSSGATCFTPVVIVTARVAAENRIECFGAGADDFVPKPYMPDEIFQALERSNSWKTRLDAGRVEGSVMLDDRDQGDTLWNLALLRNLMIARGALLPDEIRSISAVIKAIWSEIESSSRRHAPNATPATLSYELTSEGLMLTFRDPGGSVGGVRSTVERMAPQSLADARFDSVMSDEVDHSLKLVKRFNAV